jgi:hypothetical protein
MGTFKTPISRGGMRALVPVFVFLTMVLLSVTATGGTNTTAVNASNSSQIQQSLQLIPQPPPNLPEQILNYVALAYNYIVNEIQGMLQSTILVQDPGLAHTYANILAWLVSLTAIYIILTVIEVVRKFIGYIILIGWVFLIVLMVFAR